jgi:hypothetical protein
MGCMATHSEGFVNYKSMDDVYGTKSQAVDYEDAKPHPYSAAASYRRGIA